MGIGMTTHSGKGWSTCTFNNNTMWERTATKLGNRLGRWKQRQVAANRYIVSIHGNSDLIFYSFESAEVLERMYLLENPQREFFNSHPDSWSVRAKQNNTEDWNQESFPMIPEARAAWAERRIRRAFYRYTSGT